MNTLKTLKEDFNNITKLRIFEIEVINKRTQESDYIIFDIELQKNTLFASHESLNSKQEKSKKISFVKVVLNDCFSIDENLQNLYDECINAILESEFFELI
jgi:hypothetical protein